MHREVHGATNYPLLFLSAFKNSQDSYILAKHAHDVMKSNCPIIAHATP